MHYILCHHVAIRTNNGELKINAPTDSVRHYNGVDKVSVDSIYSESYHEHGSVRVNMTVNSGHVVVEGNGYVNELSIPSTTTSASVDIKPAGEVNTAVIDSTTATMAVAQGAEISQIVGNTDNISGAGAEEAKETAVEKTFVSTAEELKAAVSDPSKKYVTMSNDITVSRWDSIENVGLHVTSDLIFDGNGHNLTVNAGRGIWADEDNIELTVKNVKLIGGSSCERAVQVNGGVRGVTLYIDNFECTNISYYAINICNNADVKLSITNSKIIGYGALNLWSADYKVYVASSELIGYNDKSYNAEDWNDFGTVILEGDTTKSTTDHSSTIDVEIINTIIRAQTIGQGNKEYCILFNNQCTSNNVKLSGCTLGYNESENTFKYLDNGEGNVLMIDGVKAN